MKSRPNWFRTWCIRIVLSVLLGSIFLSFYVIPFLFYIDGTIEGSELSTFGIIYYPLLIWGSYLGLRYLKRIKGNAVKHITENREGVFYEKINGTVESLLYNQLELSSSAIVYDVFPRKIGRYGPTELSVFFNDWERTVQFTNTDAAYSYYSGNSRLLRSHFIQGITLFRPDLRIASHVYSAFYIHPETFEFDKKNYRTTIVAVTIFVILSIEWYISTMKS